MEHLTETQLGPVEVKMRGIQSPSVEKTLHLVSHGAGGQPTQVVWALVLSEATGPGKWGPLETSAQPGPQLPAAGPPPPIPHRPSEARAPFQFQVFLKQINSSLVDSNMLVRCVTLSLDRFENQVDMKGKKNP